MVTRESSAALLVLTGCLPGCRAHDRGFCQVLFYEPTGSLQQPHRLRQLELQLLQRRLCGAVRLQAGWQGRAGDSAGALAGSVAPSNGGTLTAVLLSAADGQWPLLAAAAAGSPSSEPCGNGAGATGDGSLARTAAIDAAIAAPARLKRRLQVVAGPLAGLEPDFVLVSWQGGVHRQAGCALWVEWPDAP